MEVAQQLQHKRPLDQRRRGPNVRLARMDEEFSGIMGKAVPPVAEIQKLGKEAFEKLFFI